MGVKSVGTPPTPHLLDGSEPALAENKLNSKITAKTDECVTIEDNSKKSERSGSAAAGVSNIESGFMSFPEKIMMLLNKRLAKDAMWWLPDGDAFCILPVPFTEKVLDKHFQGTKFESFTRKLNRWGFKRVAGDGIPLNSIAFYHNLFHKDKPELLKDMSGGKTRSPIETREKKTSVKGKEEITKPDLSTHHLGFGTESRGGATRESLQELERKMLRESTLHVSDDYSARQRLLPVASSQDTNRGSVTNTIGLSPGRNRIDALPNLRALLTQQMGIQSHALSLNSSNETSIREQLLRARNVNQLPADLFSKLSQQRVTEMEQLLSSSDTSRRLAQQQESFLQSSMSAENTRLLLQQLGSLNPPVSSELSSRLIAQRAGVLGTYGGVSDSSTLLDQLNPDTEIALRLLMAQQRGHAEPLSSALAATIARQQLENVETFPSADIQARLLAERLRVAEMRDNSRNIVNRLLLSQNMVRDQSSEAADLRTRLMMNTANNHRGQQALLSESGLTEQQLYELHLLEQHRARLGGGAYGR
jgi:HSF-type DNA-binding